jgi:Flp pilus assembly protein TadD
MSNVSVEVQIGQAWGNYRNGRNDAAVSEFERILKSNPDSVDAYYGLGLTQFALGKKQAASESFGRALELVNQLQAANHEEQDRYMMLARMVKQRLDDVGAQ